MTFVKSPSQDSVQIQDEKAAAGALVKGVTGIAGAQGITDALPVFEEKAITASVPKIMAHTPIGKALSGIANKLVGTNNFELEVASGDAMSVREFSVHERISSLFQIKLIALSKNPAIDFDAVVGQPARFAMHAGMQLRSWAGICNRIELIRVAADGMSTYQVFIVPSLWLLTQRKNYRMFQQIAEPDIVLQILGEWNVTPVLQIDKGSYKKRKYRVQYGESDFTFISRMLEDAGIAYYFEQHDEETKLVLSDAPQNNPPRVMPLMFMDDTSHVQKVEMEFVTAVHMSQRVRPGKVTLRDHDYRRPSNYKLMSSASGGKGIEEKLERYHYRPGMFLFGTDQGEATPIADDKGKSRMDEKEGAALAQKRLDAKRGSARVCTFQTNARDLAPGVVCHIAAHPHPAIGEEKGFLVVESSLSGADQGEWIHQCEARSTNVPFRPELLTPKPAVNGVESATVVGPAGEEIHTDEFGRVRVHFHWDRESKMDDNSSCWIHVSQPWAGAGYGVTNLPRVGQEVLVDFLGGDPDRPVIVGRIYTNLQKTPYKLPDNKTQSGWKSNSTGGTGGYNELMFEDAQGNELLRMQAEKDLKKLVKHDENVNIGNDLTTSVGHDETHTVGNDRSRIVGNNESVTVGADQTITVGGNHTTTVSGDQRNTVTGSQFNTVLGQPKEGGFNGSHTDVTGQFKMTASDTAYMSAPNKITLECQGSSITLEPMKITIRSGDNAEVVLDMNALMKSKKESKVFLDADASIHSSGNSDIYLNADAKMSSQKGSNVFLNADALFKASTGGNVKCTADVECTGTKAKIGSTEGANAEFTVDAAVCGTNTSVSGTAKVGVSGSSVSVSAAGTNEITGAVVKIN